jgi:peptide/nickel transport system ATP-binding protein
VTAAIELQDVSRRFGQPPGRFRRGAGVVHAVDGVSLTVNNGEVVGLVGESGCGKSTLGRLAAGLMQPSEGTVLQAGRTLAGLPPAEARHARLRVQMVFQDPYASLNPRMRVGDIVGEAPRLHGLVDGPYAAFVDAQLRRAGLDPALQRRYPHQLSGGQRQRVGIARALAVGPDVLVCDEAVAALDVSIQAQILNLFADLREQLGLTYLFISHDLGVVQHLSDRVVIMYLGRVVEQAGVAELFAHPNHPYTQALLAEVPRIETRHRSFSALKGELPSPVAPPPGCHFHTRCPHAMARCTAEIPALKPVAPGHLSACHLNDMH